MPPDESQGVLAFAAFLLATGATVATVLAWRCGWLHRRFWLLSSTVGLLACGIVLLRCAVAYGGTSSRLPSLEMMGLSLGSLGLGVPLLVALGQLRFPGAQASAKTAQRLLLTHLIMTVAAWWTFQRTQAEPWDEIPTRAELLNRDLIEGVELVTDRGRRVPLYRSRVSGTLEIDQTESDSELWKDVERVADPDRDSNCHGWVFASGRYVVEAEHVDWILQDNGYQKVDQPAPGDLIIYRYQDGSPMHSGIVRAVDADGLPRIESKWGLGGRYLHSPRNPLYQGRIEYYRNLRLSSRG